ncbi:unnamed protein product [Rotaria sordida]|uniref:Uncharacterized protein n=1 Tax=Rotaria sordida TaxID=392033 RepID=A0A815WGG1_9BILA|nr:unnamed protein product [Rotaria sordida]CAF1544437.1 unnamed protein product [Rotaria sordida]CAF1544493.1 unnamed protein product [Rotaria sordida]
MSRKRGNGRRFNNNFSRKPSNGERSSDDPNLQESLKSNSYRTYTPLVSFAPPSAEVDDESTYYTVNLQLSPVQMGIMARNDHWQQQFKGLGAFNHYFGLLTTTANGYELCDVWDGYFHLTLVKFRTSIPPDDLECLFRSFTSHACSPAIPNLLFRGSQLAVHPGTTRKKERKKIDFVVLYIDLSPEIQEFYQAIQDLLNDIRKQAKASNWNLIPIDKLHVTIRKYSNTQIDIKAIPIKHLPIEFHCSRLEIKQTREQGLARYEKARKEGNNYQWWSGVTVIDGTCLGCRKWILSQDWAGFCLQCGKYESVKPVWSTDDIKDHLDQKLEEQGQNVETSTLNEK